MQALPILGNKSISCTPSFPADDEDDDDESKDTGDNLEAGIYVDRPSLSPGSGGICTKWRISEADVPMYRFPSTRVFLFSDSNLLGYQQMLWYRTVHTIVFYTVYLGITFGTIG